VSQLTGVVGRIDYGYFPAATLEGFTITRTPAGVYRLRGRCVQANTFNLSQRPLVFVVPTQLGDWRYPIEDLTIADGHVSARLGPPIP
jgi:hypothetical protein